VTHGVAAQGSYPVSGVLGKRWFERNGWRFEQISAANWKMMGVAYILFGLMLAWSIESVIY